MYAPMPKKKLCPRAIWPVYPITTWRPKMATPYAMALFRRINERLYLFDPMFIDPTSTKAKPIRRNMAMINAQTPIR